MTPPQMADLLNLISSTDGRNLTQQMPSAWMDIIGDLDFADAKAAVVKHFQTSTEWLMPAHVRKGVTSIRDKRLMAVGVDFIYPNRADDEIDMITSRRELINAIASGRMTKDDFQEYSKSDVPFREWAARELAA